MKFRGRLIASLGVTLLLVSASGVVLYQNRLLAQTYGYLLEAKDAEVAQHAAKTQVLTRKIEAAQLDLAAKNDELNKKKAELDKATKDLATKLADLEAAQKKIKSQESQIASNSSELTKLRNRPPLFTFRVDATGLTDPDQKKDDIKQVVNAAYDVIVDVYGSPYLLHEVVITFVDSFSNPNAAAETEISNGKDGLTLTIRLKDFDKNSFNDVNAVIHEIIHSFHGLAYLTPIAYEEGITVAAADAVMEKMITAGSIPSFSPLYIRISGDTYNTTSLAVPENDASFYGSSQVAQYYQLAGYGWWRIYKSNTNFFKTFNEKIYAQKRGGTEITAEVVKDLIGQSATTVDGKSIADWLKTKAFALQ